MKILGPLSSENGGSRRFFVDFSNQLNSGENLSTIDISCDDTDITISSESILTDDITTSNGDILPEGKTVTFRAACSVSKNIIVLITVSYTTTDSNADSSTVKLKIVPTIL